MSDMPLKTLSRRLDAAIDYQKPRGEPANLLGPMLGANYDSPNRTRKKDLARES